MLTRAEQVAKIQEVAAEYLKTQPPGCHSSSSAPSSIFNDITAVDTPGPCTAAENAPFPTQPTIVLCAVDPGLDHYPVADAIQKGLQAVSATIVNPATFTTDFDNLTFPPCVQPADRLRAANLTRCPAHGLTHDALASLDPHNICQLTFVDDLIDSGLVKLKLDPIPPTPGKYVPPTPAPTPGKYVPPSPLPPGTPTPATLDPDVVPAFPPSATSKKIPAWIIAVIVVGAVVIVAAVILAIVFGTRHKASAPAPAPRT